MPLVYLSPSTQEFNEYITGGSEEYYMNLVADAMIPYLNASGISYVRNTPDMTASQSIYQSNQGNYDFHLAIHSNAGPESLAGALQGTDVYYYPSSTRGQEAAEIIAENFRAIYPEPENVSTVPTTRLGEVRLTKAPAVLIEVAYHDNPEDEAWIRANIDEIAQNLVLSLTEYFGIPFIEPSAPYTGTVNINYGALNIRERPSVFAPILTTAENDEVLDIIGQSGDWYLVNYNGIYGYVNTAYVTV